MFSSVPEGIFILYQADTKGQKQKSGHRDKGNRSVNGLFSNSIFSQTKIFHNEKVEIVRVEPQRC